MASKMRIERPTDCPQCVVEVRSGSQDWANVAQMATRLVMAPVVVQRYRTQRGAMSWSGLLVRKVRKRPKRHCRQSARRNQEAIQLVCAHIGCEQLEPLPQLVS